MKSKLMKLPKHLTPEPGNKPTKSHLVEAISKKILKFSKAVYNKSLSPTYIDILERLKIRGESYDDTERFRKPTVIKKNQFVSGRKLHPERINILNLPRLPFGKHLNYEENDFKSHFVGSFENPDSEELKSVSKMHRLQKKYNLKHKQTQSLTPAIKSNLNNYIVFSTDASDIKCLKDQEVMKSYEKESSKFKLIATYQDLNLSESVEIPKKQNRKIRPKLEKIQVSLGDIERILRPEILPIFSKKSLIFNN